MKGSMRVLCAAMAATLIAPAVAQAQTDDDPPDWPARGGQTLPGPEPFEVKIGPLVRGSAPEQLDRTWLQVVEAMRWTMMQLQQATPPAVTGGAAWMQPRATLGPVAPTILLEQAGTRFTPAEGPLLLLRLGPVRVFAAPIVAELPSVAMPRPEVAVLPGIALQLPWRIP